MGKNRSDGFVLQHMTDIIPTQASPDDVMDDVQLGDEIIVEYNSSRANRIVRRRGMVTDFSVKTCPSFIEFDRACGQKMRIDGLGNCYSIGSNHPYNGELTRVELDK